MTSHRFLAFVEDVSATSSVAGESSEAGKLIAIYKTQFSKKPTHLVWLDGIEEQYFNSLTWTDTPCDTKLQSDREQRRNHLNSLDSKRLSVFFLALHKDDNSAFYEELAESAWLEISIFDSGVDGSVPGFQSDDYEQEQLKIVWIVFEERIERNLLSKLRNVFSLAHLEEANFNSCEEVHYEFTPFQNATYASGYRDDDIKHDFHNSGLERGES